MADLVELASWVDAMESEGEATAGAGPASLRPGPEIHARTKASSPDDVIRVSDIGTADGQSCVFAVDARTFELALASAAGAILAAGGLRSDAVEANLDRVDRRVLWVRDARYAFAVIARRLEPARLQGEVARSAEIAEDAVIGERTVIGPGAVIEAGVRVGADCTIGARVAVLRGTTVGDRVLVKAGAVLGSDGFGYVRHRATGEYVRFPQQGTLVIEDDVEIGANTTIDRGALGETRIGRGTKIDNLVHIGHNCRIGRDVVMAAQTGVAGSSTIEDGAILGGQVGIGDHATVGQGVILGGQAGVLNGKRLHGAGRVFWGTPAQPVERYLRDLAKLRRSRS